MSVWPQALSGLSASISSNISLENVTIAWLQQLFVNNKVLGEPSKIKSAETWEMFPSGDDPPAPYPTWDFFKLENFFEME